MSSLLIRGVPGNWKFYSDDEIYNWMFFFLWTYYRDGLIQTAYSALLNIENDEKEEVIVERANWYSCQKKHHEALLCAQGFAEFTTRQLSAKVGVTRPTLDV